MQYICRTYLIFEKRDTMIYRYKATIPGNKVFMREYELDSSMSLFKLHDFLCDDLEFAPDQMTVFDTAKADGKKVRRIGPFDFGDGAMDTVHIDQTVERGEVILRFYYNMGLNLFIELVLIGEAQKNPRYSYPLLVAEKGRNPDQFSAKYEDYSDFSSGSDTEEEDSYEDDELPEGEEGL